MLIIKVLIGHRDINKKTSFNPHSILNEESPQSKDEETKSPCFPILSANGGEPSQNWNLTV